MTPERLAEIKARADAATDGPWGKAETGTPSIINVGSSRLSIRGVLFATNTPEDQFRQVLADADFIAHSREDVPYLLAHIERLEKALEEAMWAWEEWQLDDVRETGEVGHEFGKTDLPNLAAWLKAKETT